MLFPFQNKVWSTLEKDPLFSRGFGTPSLEEQRKLSFQRVCKVYEYDFLPDDELFRSPVKHQVLTNCLGSYDWTIAAKISLNSEVSFIILYPYSYRPPDLFRLEHYRFTTINRVTGWLSG